MKKILFTLAAVILSAGVMSAQDLSQATESYNNGATALSSGEKTQALEFFQTALKQATECGEEGAEVVNNCKNVIPNITLSIAKDLIKAANFDGAVEGLQKAATIAEEFGAADILEEAKGLVPTVLMAKGNNFLKEKNFAGAAEVFKSIVDADATNGMAALRLGMALNSAGDAEGAIAAFTQAVENGQQAAASKQLSTIYLKNAAADLKAKSFDSAIKAALKSAEYSESGNAYKIAGTAANSLGNKADAVKYLSKYLELSPNAADAAQIKAAVEALKK